MPRWQMLLHLWSVARQAGGKRALDRIFGREPVVLMYHRFSRTPAHGKVDAASFEKQLAFLSKHCNVISLGELHAGLIAGRSWPSSTVAITIDDGYRDMYDIAFPLLKRYRAAATVFITTDFVTGKLWYWQDKLRHIVQSSTVRELRWQSAAGVQTGHLDTAQDRADTWNRLADHCYGVSAAERNAVIDDVARQSGVRLPTAAPETDAAMDWSQLRQIAEEGVEVGSHGVSHQRLAELSSGEQHYEIATSRQVIEAELQRTVDLFAYPFGGPADVNEAARNCVERAGYRLGCVSYFDEHLYRDLYAMRRFGVGPEYWDFIKAADGLKRARSLQKGASS